MDIIFKDINHKVLYVDILNKMEYCDSYHKCVAYLLSLDDVCSKHIPDIFNFLDDCIKLNALTKSWQTSTSLKTTRLAFNLWNGCCDDGEEYVDNDGYKVPLPSSKYAVDNIFDSPLAKYYFVAVNLRFFGEKHSDYFPMIL